MLYRASTATTALRGLLDFSASRVLHTVTFVCGYSAAVKGIWRRRTLSAYTTHTQTQTHSLTYGHTHREWTRGAHVFIFFVHTLPHPKTAGRPRPLDYDQINYFRI